MVDVNLTLDETQESPEYVLSSGSFTEGGETGFALKIATGYDSSYERGQLGIRLNGIDAWATNDDMLVQENTTTVIGVSYENDKVHFLKRNVSIGTWSMQTLTLASVLDPVDTNNIILGAIPMVAVGELEAHLSVADGNVASVTASASSVWSNNWQISSAINGTLATATDNGGSGIGGSNGCCWLSANGTYNGNSGNYQGAISTGGVLGEWAQFTFPEPKRITQITYYITGWWHRYPLPGSISLMGSDDASTWTLVDSWTDIEYSSVITSSCSNATGHARWREPTTITTDNLTKYKYFRIVTTRTSGSAGPPLGCGGGNQGLNNVVFQQIELYGNADGGAGGGHSYPLAVGSSIENARVFNYTINTLDTFYVPPVKEAKLRISNISFEDRDGNIITPPSIFTYPSPTVTPEYPVSNLTDGDTSTYFETPLSTSENPVAIVVDLGEPPVAVNKMIINNADDSEVARIEALQHTRLVATDDDRIKQDSNMIQLSSIDWLPTLPPSYSSSISTSLHTGALAQEGSYANATVGRLSDALPDASVVRFNDLTNTERFEINFQNWNAIENSPTTISVDPGLEGDVLTVSCAGGFSLNGQGDGPTSFNLTCELKDGVLQWTDPSACYFIE